MKSLIVPVLALFVVTGCSERAAPVDVPSEVAAPAAEIMRAAPPLPSVTHAKATDLAFGNKDEQLALPLFGEQTVSGHAVSNVAGELVGVAFLVGNYGNASRGAITLEACVREECRTSSIDTASSIDNEMLAFPLGSPLLVTEGEEIVFKLTREAGGNEFAIWTYPAVEGASRLDSADAAFQNRTPRIQLLLN